MLSAWASLEYLVSKLRPNLASLGANNVSWLQAVQIHAQTIFEDAQHVVFASPLGSVSWQHYRLWCYSNDFLPVWYNWGRRPDQPLAKRGVCKKYLHISLTWQLFNPLTQCTLITILLPANASLWHQSQLTRTCTHAQQLVPSWARQPFAPNSWNKLCEYPPMYWAMQG